MKLRSRGLHAEAVATVTEATSWWSLFVKELFDDMSPRGPKPQVDEWAPRKRESSPHGNFLHGACLLSKDAPVDECYLAVLPGAEAGGTMAMNLAGEICLRRGDFKEAMMWCTRDRGVDLGRRGGSSGGCGRGLEMLWETRTEPVTLPWLVEALIAVPPKEGGSRGGTTELDDDVREVFLVITSESWFRPTRLLPAARVHPLMRP